MSLNWKWGHYVKICRSLRGNKNITNNQMKGGYSFVNNETYKVVNSRENTLEREVEALVGIIRGGEFKGKYIRKGGGGISGKHKRWCQ
jgi:hypothetical protein